MAKYKLLVYTENEYLRNKFINNSKSQQLFYKDGQVTDILAGDDSGVDIFFKEDVVIYPGDTELIGTGIKCKMINVYTNIAVGYYMYPRSSICKTPLRLANSVGIIDSGYRGEIKVPLTNTPNISVFMTDKLMSVDTDTKYSFEIKKGMRLVQICAPDLSPFSITFVNNLDETIRGEGGFGSTGI